MNAQDMTLGDFVQQLLLELGDIELHFKNERPWHELFYRLKGSPKTPGKPRFFDDLFFDWNGEYPKCLQLSEYLHALHWTGSMAAANPGYDRFKLNRDVGNRWAKQLDNDLGNFLHHTAEGARDQLAVLK